MGMQQIDYFMENDDEAFRLDLKTDPEVVKAQALWAGIRPGMRVADICCGAGKTTAVLQDLVAPTGTTVGIDGSPKRIEYARNNYGGDGIEFSLGDIRGPIKSFGLFDFVWVRFVLEYYRENGPQLVENISTIVKPGGILCLIDLDHNCLSHFGMPEQLEATLFGLMKRLELEQDFDPYAGRKGYAYLYRLGYTDIDVQLGAHHLIYGALNEVDSYNWTRKIEVAAKRLDFRFDAYPSGYKGFLEDFQRFFSDPARFTYTPFIAVRGVKP
jgi:SAM-dependent methyltransferase